MEVKVDVYVMLWCIVLCYAMPCCVMLYCVVLCYATLCHPMLCHVMLFVLHRFVAYASLYSVLYIISSHLITSHHTSSDIFSPGSEIGDRTPDQRLYESIWMSHLPEALNARPISDLRSRPCRGSDPISDLRSPHCRVFVPVSDLRSPISMWRNVGKWC